MTKTKTLSVRLQLKSVDAETGVFVGYGSVFGVEDSYKEVVKAGAFARSLAAHKSAGTMPAMLWQHRSAEPVGVWTSMVEDENGLLCTGQLALKTQRGAEAHELMKLGALTGLSIGYATVSYEYDKTTGITTLTDLELWEVSPVTFPANDSARISVVKSATPCDTIREFEAALRDALGFSAKEAKALASAGWPGLKRRDAVEAEAEKLQSGLDGLISSLKT